ncbi:MAG: hypothetical protein AVDCRST_MAG11-447, partial [uncultured Gemmatimonadaceae bacterium]
DRHLPAHRARRRRPLGALRHRRRDRHRPGAPLLRPHAPRHRHRHLARRAPAARRRARRLVVLPERARRGARLGVRGARPLLRRLRRRAPQPEHVVAARHARLRGVPGGGRGAPLDDGPL